MTTCHRACRSLGVAGLLCVVLPWLAISVAPPAARWLGLETPIYRPGRVLIVLAHPDDETIFFSPTISALRSAGHHVFLLSLTNGNAHGLGQRRAMELQSAAAALQVEASHVTVIDSEQIQDGHHTVWDLSEVVQILELEVSRRHISTVITFDKEGVYGHKNHAACYQGVRQYLLHCMANSHNAGQVCPEGWELLSVSNARRYSSLLDVLPSAMEARLHEVVTYINRSLMRTLWAMYHHNTQWRWWRHVLLTRYTFVNTLKQILPALPDTGYREATILPVLPQPNLPVWHKARVARALRMGMGPAEMSAAYLLDTQPPLSRLQRVASDTAMLSGPDGPAAVPSDVVDPQKAGHVLQGMIDELAHPGPIHRLGDANRSKPAYIKHSPLDTPEGLSEAILQALMAKKMQLVR